MSEQKLLQMKSLESSFMLVGEAFVPLKLTRQCDMRTRALISNQLSLLWLCAPKRKCQLVPGKNNDRMKGQTSNTLLQ
jgi:hypothetical protein